MAILVILILVISETPVPVLTTKSDLLDEKFWFRCYLEATSGLISSLIKHCVFWCQE